MRVEVIPIADLSKDLQQQWLKIQASNPNVASPCLHPELFIAGGKLCPGICVAVLHYGNKMKAFWPFQKDQASPAAKQLRLCDYAAIIGPRSQHWDIDIIMKKTNLKTWEFRALLDCEHIKLTEGTIEYSESPRVDLTQGLEEYLVSQKHRKAGYKDILYKQRLIERTLGPIRFVPICRDLEILERMLSWKKDRYNISPEWLRVTTGILEQIYSSDTSSLSGVLSALYIGDEMVAASFCLRFQGILHGILISFNPDFAKYSPGSLLIFSLISRLQDFQCHILDFGPGAGAYKLNFANKTVPVIRGNFQVYSLKDKIKSIKWLYSGLYPFVQATRKVIHQLDHSPKTAPAATLNRTQSYL